MKRTCNRITEQKYNEEISKEFENPATQEAVSKEALPLRYSPRNPNRPPQFVIDEVESMIRKDEVKRVMQMRGDEAKRRADQLKRKVEKPGLITRLKISMLNKKKRM